jgi:hypothetical protein
MLKGKVGELEMKWLNVLIKVLIETANYFETNT